MMNKTIVVLAASLVAGSVMAEELRQSASRNTCSNYAFEGHTTQASPTSPFEGNFTYVDLKNGRVSHTFETITLLGTLNAAPDQPTEVVTGHTAKPRGGPRIDMEYVSDQKVVPMEALGLPSDPDFPLALLAKSEVVTGRGKNCGVLVVGINQGPEGPSAGGKIRLFDPQTGMPGEAMISGLAKLCHCR